MGVKGQQSRKEIGKIGESIAAQFLAAKGFKILSMNYLKPWGEIDIIAEYRGTVRFVEVKTLAVERLAEVSHETNNYRPEEQVHAFKLKKIARTAEIYMNEKKDNRDYQIDVVGVYLSLKDRTARCRLFEQVL